MDTFTGLYSRKSFYCILLLLLLFLIPFTFIEIKHLKAVLSPFETHANIFHSNRTSFELVKFNVNHKSFKQQLFDDRLASYNLFYNDSLPICSDQTNSLNNDQKTDWQKMSELLKTFRNHTVPYPTDHFYGRGIVLTAGTNQIKYAKVNLKMIELTRTNLSVQV